MSDKNIIIISTHPSTDRLYNLLKESIYGIKKLGWDILLISSLPLNKEITEQVNYYIYDKENPILPPQKTPHIFADNDVFYSKVYVGGHALSITRKINISLNFAKNLGYEFTYFMDSDLIFKYDDTSKLSNLNSEMNKQKKELIFFNPKDYLINSCGYGKVGPYFFETDIFGGNINYILNNLPLPLTNQEWEDLGMCYKLEVTFNDRLKNKLGHILLINDYSSNFFTKSDININRYGLFISEFIENLNDKTKPILLLQNIEDSISTYKTKIYVNGLFHSENINEPSTWTYYTFDLDNIIIRIEVYEIFNNIESHLETKIYNLNEINLKNKGEIKFKHYEN